MKFNLIGIGVMFEDLIFDTKFKHYITTEYEHDLHRYICIESGGKEAVMHFTRSTGGSSANLVCGLSKLDDYRLGYFSKLGVDHVSNWLIEDLESFGVNTDGIVLSKNLFMGPGSSAIITDRGAKDRSILTYRGIGDEIDVNDVRVKEDYLRNAQWHAISSFSNADAIQALKMVLELEKGNDIKLLFTPTMSMIGPLMDETIEIVKHASMVALNDTEAMMLAGTRDLYKAADKIQRLGPDSVLVTRGRQGLIVVDKKRFYVADQTYDVEIRNTVGAGDLSAAAFWHYTQRGLDETTAVKRVLAAGAMKIRFAGAKMGLPEEKEVEEFIKEKGELSVQTKDR